MPGTALRNPSGALRTGIGFRFCQGEGANLACPTWELFWGENRPFPEAGAGCRKEGLRVPELLLPRSLPQPRSAGDQLTPNLSLAALTPAGSLFSSDPILYEFPPFSITAS